MLTADVIPEIRNDPIYCLGPYFPSIVFRPVSSKLVESLKELSVLIYAIEILVYVRKFRYRIHATYVSYVKHTRIKKDGSTAPNLLLPPATACHIDD